MSVINLFSASHCYGNEVAQGLCDKLGYKALSDEALLKEAAQRFQVSEERLDRTMHGVVSVFNSFTHEKERNTAFLRASLAELVQPDNLVYHGFAGHLLPKELTHVLRVCLVAPRKHRAGMAAKTEGISEEAAEKQIRNDDEARGRWTLHLFGLGPWDESLYDVLVPMDSTSVEAAVDLIAEQTLTPPVKTTSTSQKSMMDFLLTAQVQLALVQKGHDVDLGVASDDGNVTLTINRYVLMLENLKKRLREVTLGVSGVKDVKIDLGPHFRPLNRYEQMAEDYAPAPKFLLVDDEKEFVLTLSERLKTRNLGAAVAHDGEEALSILEADTPDVMVLDLKMPGIQGLEVLQRVKREKPDTEVIILTGHGSAQEEQQAMDLGAFAYLNKPVDIDVLAETMRKAYEKIKSPKEDAS